MPFFCFLICECCSLFKMGLGAVSTPASSDDEELFLSTMKYLLLVSTESKSIGGTWVTFKWDGTRLIRVFTRWPISITNRQLKGSVLPQGAFGNRDGGTDVDGSAAGTVTTSSSSNPQYNFVSLSTRWSAVSIWQQQSCFQIKALWWLKECTFTLLWNLSLFLVEEKHSK